VQRFLDKAYGGHMPLHLLLLLVASQVLYEWTDAEGTHFTDDRTTIPRGAKVKTTAGDDISVVEGHGPATRGANTGAPDAGVRTSAPASRPQVDTCAVARRAVAEAEQALSRNVERVDPGEQCLAQLQHMANNGFARAEYARCMAGRQAQGESHARDEFSKQQLESARDALRRAQAAGCQ
jgi:hypothetical protein